jgi:DNA-binding transcriptional ArsR family regulator
MVEEHALDAVFHALADPTRRGILQVLSQGERSLGEVASPFDMTLAGASKHVKVLEAAGLLQRRVQGRRHLLALRAERLAAVDAWLRTYEQYWREGLSALADAIDADIRDNHEQTEEGDAK